MKAIELLEIVNCMCTPQESYSVYQHFVKQTMDNFSDAEIPLYMRSFFLGENGVMLNINYEKIRQSDSIIVLYPKMDEDGEVYHDFAPIYEESLFEGKLDNGQLVYIFNLE
jgi:hypothetical protein